MATMFRWVARIGVPVLFVVFLLVTLKRREDRMHIAYQQIAIGMDLARAESLLGSPGTMTAQRELPRYPHRYVVQGDTFYEWTDDEYGRRVIVGFVGGRVHDKWYWEPDL
jgi:hypothetical protein